jgi:multidrug efflux pump subunit AcrA (membrane-fusion protein)
MGIDLTKKQIYIGAAIVIGTVALLWLAFRPAAIQVETATAVRSQLLDTVDAEGRTRVQNKFIVTAPVSGKLKRITLREGDHIPRSYMITEIDPNPPIPRSPAPDNPGPNAYAAKIYAPATGRILRIFEKSERFLEAGTPLMEIGDPSNLEVVADILSNDAVKVRPGLRMLIEDPSSGEFVVARVRTVEPQASTKISALGVEEKRVDIVADFVGKKPAYGDNFRIDVRIVVWQGNDVLCVPNSALFRADEGWHVFVIKGGRAYSRKVETGHRSRTDTQILDGLVDGDTVVVYPPNNLADGDRVSVD